MVLLQSSDNEQFRIEKDIITRSVLVRNMLEDVGEDDTKAIPLPNVTATILKKVLEFCEYHRNEPLPDPSLDTDVPALRQKIEISEWDEKFYNVDQDMMFEVILAADYLDIKDLLDAGCKTAANMMKDKTPEEIRKMFNVVDDFTPEEREMIKQENKWAE